jgi:sterol 3beta-glucosyltransferase
MRIDILAIGSHGDVRPAVALALGLQTVGHRVRIVALSGFEELVRGHGVDYLPIAGSPRQIAGTAEGREWIRQRTSTIGFLRGFVRVACALIEEGIASYWRACQDVDALIVSSMGLPVGLHIAERLRVPLVRMHAAPFVSTRYDWGGGWSLRSAVEGDLRACAFTAFRFAIWRRLRPTTNTVRRDVLGLPPLRVLEPFRALERARVPALDAYSPSVVTRPPDWGRWIHVTGYWFLDAGAWTPPRELADFLDTGPPPVFVGFGSTPFPAPEAATDVVIEALARAGRRGVVVAGGSGLATGRLADHVLGIEAVPHDWLFPRVSAAVHHGGAGVTGAALRAGLPSVVVPVFADQPFWARRVFDLGAGPRPIPARRLTPEALAGAIRRALGDDAIRRRAAAIGRRIRAEDGVARAVEAFHASVGVQQAVCVAAAEC